MAAMAAAASAPTAVAAAVGEGADDPNMPGLVTQPDGMKDSDNDDDEDDDNDEINDEDRGEDKEEGGSRDITAATAMEEMLLLVDAANGFNNLSRYSMLWTVRHRCPRLSRLTFNCYRHQVRLVSRQLGGKNEIILSKEGVTQGDSLEMALYGIVLLPLAEVLRERFPDVLQP